MTAACSPLPAPRLFPRISGEGPGCGAFWGRRSYFAAPPPVRPRQAFCRVNSHPPLPARPAETLGRPAARRGLAGQSLFHAAWFRDFFTEQRAKTGYHQTRKNKKKNGGKNDGVNGAPRRTPGQNRPPRPKSGGTARAAAARKNRAQHLILGLYSGKLYYILRI